MVYAYRSFVLYYTINAALKAQILTYVPKIQHPSPSPSLRILQMIVFGYLDWPVLSDVTAVHVQEVKSFWHTRSVMEFKLC